MKEHFSRKYAPNTRETVRREAVHEFQKLGLIVRNPNDPSRAVNSPKNRFMSTDPVLHLIRSYGNTSWIRSLERYLSHAPALSNLRPSERDMVLIPVTLPGGKSVKLSAGGQNDLLKKIIEEFCSRFAPGGVVLHLGDAERKQLHLDTAYLERLGLTFDEHGHKGAGVAILLHALPKEGEVPNADLARAVTRQARFTANPSWHTKS